MGMEVYVHVVLSCVLGRGGCSALQPGCISVGQRFPIFFFGYGTPFNLVNIYETRVFCGAFIKQVSKQRDLFVTKWNILI
jgi:hypothetical protein